MRPKWKDISYQTSRAFVWVFELLLAMIGIAFVVPILDEAKGIAAIIFLIIYMIARSVLFAVEPKPTR